VCFGFRDAAGQTAIAIQRAFEALGTAIGVEPQDRAVRLALSTAFAEIQLPIRLGFKRVLHPAGLWQPILTGRQLINRTITEFENRHRSRTGEAEYRARLHLARAYLNRIGPRYVRTGRV
jgi:hypothetical protein